MSKANLDQSKIKHIAHLANLNLTPEEETLYEETLSGILRYVDKLDEVDTSKVEPTFSVAPVKNAFREDNPQTLFTQDQALKNAKSLKNGNFEVPKVVKKDQ